MQRRSGRWRFILRRWTMPKNSPACSQARLALTREERLSIEREEGWTLGVLSGRQMQPRLALPSLPVSRPTAGTVTELIGRDRNLQASLASSSEAELPECDFVYFATPACGSWTITAEFVDSAKAIIAHAYNNAGLRMPLIQHLRPGHQHSASVWCRWEVRSRFSLPGLRVSRTGTHSASTPLMCSAISLRSSMIA